VVVLIVTATTATAAALITSADIKDGTIQSVDIKNNTIASADIKDGTVSSADIANGTITSGDIKDLTIALSDLNAGAKATVQLGIFGPKGLANQPDTGCATDDPVQAPWATDTMDRLYSVEPAEDGTGFFATRYDLNGTFTTLNGGQHPGCTDAALFVAPTESGTWNGVWTKKVTGNFDYNPEATLPAPPGWDEFIEAVFTNDVGPAPTVVDVSYEFDYYLECAAPGAQHWRDANYGGVSIQEGNIGDC
jgi:hypothetical protein